MCDNSYLIDDSFEVSDKDSELMKSLSFLRKHYLAEKSVEEGGENK